MITLEMMPPMMFGGLVLAMLIGFPRAASVNATGKLIAGTRIYSRGPMSWAASICRFSN